MLDPLAVRLPCAAAIESDRTQGQRYASTPGLDCLRSSVPAAVKELPVRAPRCRDVGAVNAGCLLDCLLENFEPWDGPPQRKTLHDPATLRERNTNVKQYAAESAEVQRRRS